MLDAYSERQFLIFCNYESSVLLFKSRFLVLCLMLFLFKFDVSCPTFYLFAAKLTTCHKTLNYVGPNGHFDISHSFHEIAIYILSVFFSQFEIL